MLGFASNALIIGFNVRPDANARKISESEKVDVRLYRVIYDAIDDVKATYDRPAGSEDQGDPAGTCRSASDHPYAESDCCRFLCTGRKNTNSCQIRLIRDGIVVHEGQIASLRRFKDDVKEVAEGFECGIAIDSYRDVKEGMSSRHSLWKKQRRSWNKEVLMSELRVRRIQEFIKQEIGSMLLRDIKDSRLGFVTVTGVAVTGDFRQATVYVSLMGKDKEKKDPWTLSRRPRGSFAGRSAGACRSTTHRRSFLSRTNH